ncbi:hypothetical protein B0H16DRAFT_1897771 [Mycena metata]|uniref:F-box domain-containing protein n=1 Tax=Mycena metata TaxID=1033252 RepID=A0AAD7HDJ2_9AGAR|nr:hypothetical protein B0H16DRAFT_1897771 [Mycena metata]
MSQSAGILALPTEILTKIFEDDSIAPDQLLSLALVCRTFHFIALPLYLAEHGFRPSSTQVSIQMGPRGCKLLTGLLIALFTPKTDSIHCTFPHPSGTSIFPLLPYLERLERYISRLSSVESVSLDFSSSGCPEPSRCRCLSTGDDTALRAWGAHLRRLLNCIVRKNCSSLSFNGGTAFTAAYEPAPPPPPRTRFASIRNILPRIFLPRRTVKGFQRVAEQGRQDVKMSLPMFLGLTSNLRSLSIGSAILILPPALNWTLMALRPIESLTLRTRAVTAIQWRSVLPLIATAARSLTSLDLWVTERIPPSRTDILQFISCLPRLRSLQVFELRENQDQDSPPIRVHLPALDTIQATPAFVHDLLRHPSSRTPKLQSLNLPCFRVRSAFDFATTSTSMKYIVQTLNKYGVSPYIQIFVKMSCDLLENYTCTTVDLTQYKCPSHYRFAGITILRIDHTLTFTVEDVPILAAWIALCPSAQRVELTDPRGLLRTARKDAELGKAIRETVKATGLLDRVIVNGVVYELDAGSSAAVSR